MINQKYKYKLMNQFGPKIGYFSLNNEELSKLVKLTDSAISQKSLEKKSNRLAGQLEKEITLPTQLLEGEHFGCLFTDIMKEYVILSMDEIGEQVPDEKITAVMTEAWINSQYENEYNPVHYHPGCTLSAVIYLKVPKFNDREIHKNTKKENIDGCICFINKTVEHTALERSTITVMPKEGDLYIWPSKLLHCVYPFQGPGERRSIAFNGWFSL